MEIIAFTVVFENEEHMQKVCEAFKEQLIEQYPKDLTATFDSEVLTQFQFISQIKTKQNQPTMTRQQYNKEILRDLEKLVDQYPDQRFGQIIANYVFPNYRSQDFFYEEPSETIKTTSAYVDPR